MPFIRGEAQRPLLHKGDWVHLRVQVVEDYGDEVMVVLRGRSRAEMAPIQTTISASFDHVIGYEPGPFAILAREAGPLTTP